MRYDLYYWPSIQGRGEFVRLALEQAGADYADIARMPSKKDPGMAAMMRMLGDKSLAHPPFAPPFLKAGKVVIAQTPNILLYLGPRLGLVPKDEAARLWAHQLQLTIADLVTEVHDSHHPIASGLYYEDQKPESKRRAADLKETRLPKFLGYFERVAQSNAGRMVGRKLSYPDLSMFQVVAGLRYAFPRTMHKLEPRYPGLVALHDRVTELPRIAAYLASKRRIAFNQQGIFRRYPELDAPAANRKG